MDLKALSRVTWKQSSWGAPGNRLSAGYFICDRVRSLESGLRPQLSHPHSFVGRIPVCLPSRARQFRVLRPPLVGECLALRLHQSKSVKLSWLEVVGS